MNFLRSYRRIALILGLLAASLPGNTIMRSPLIRRLRNRSRGSGPEGRRRRQVAGLMALLYGAVAAGGLGPRVTTPSGLQYDILAEGSGPAVQNGQVVTIHEMVTLASGVLVFSTYEKGTPITFTLGANEVIAGLEEGVTGMKVGERRRLIIPPSLNRPSSSPPDAPPNSTLHVDLLLMAIRPG
jgi:hypothetical protein